MDLTPYLESLNRDLAAAAAPGGPEISRAAELITGSLDASARLTLMEVLSDATAEITSKLNSATVEVRLRGREADLVVTEVTAPEPAGQEPPAPVGAADPTDGADLARVTLRLPEFLKQRVEAAAGSEGVSVNAWLVRAVNAAVSAGPSQPGRHPGRTVGNRITGFAQS
jgi:hypothetical protein